MLNLSSYHDATITLDGQAVTFLVKRLSFGEAEAYRKRLRWFLSARGQTPPEGASPAEAEAFTDQIDKDASAFAQESVETLTALKPGQVSVDGMEITTGADIVRVFGGNTTAVVAILIAIGVKNEASAQEKKAWWSLSGLDDSSDAPIASGPAVPGPQPAPTAERAAPVGMTAPEAATGETDAPSSGSTATSN